MLLNTWCCGPMGSSRLHQVPLMKRLDTKNPTVCNVLPFQLGFSAQLHHCVDWVQTIPRVLLHRVAGAPLSSPGTWLSLVFGSWVVGGGADL